MDVEESLFTTVARKIKINHMNRLFIAASFLLIASVVLGSNLSGQIRGYFPTPGTDDTVPDVSLVQLIAQPEKFDGKGVRFIGFQRIEFEGNAIYLHREDFGHGIARNVAAILIRPMASQEPPTPRQLIDAAHRVSDLTLLGPYTLTANVTVDSEDKKTIKTGHLTITRDRGRTREELEIGGVREVRIFAGGKTYVVPPPGLLDGMGLMDLDRRWDPVNLIASRFHAVRRDKVQDTDAWCMSRGSGAPESSSCFDAVKGVYLGIPEDSRSNQYFDFAAVGNQLLYPRRALIFKNNYGRIEVSSIEIKPGANEDLFALPDNAMEIEKCRGLDNLKRVYAPELSFPEKERKQKRQGIVSLSVIVDKEGNVAVAHVLTAPTEGFAREAEAEVRKWRYLPTTCEQPAYREAYVELDFHLY